MSYACGGNHGINGFDCEGYFCSEHNHKHTEYLGTESCECGFPDDDEESDDDDAPTD